MSTPSFNSFALKKKNGFNESGSSRVGSRSDLWPVIRLDGLELPATSSKCDRELKSPPYVTI